MSYLLKKKISQIKKKIIKRHILELSFSEICLYAQHRISNLLSNSVAASREEIKYNLCEVGPGRSRIDPWTLEIVLQSSTFQSTITLESIDAGNNVFYFRSRDAKQGVEEAIKLKTPILANINALLEKRGVFSNLTETIQNIAQINGYELHNDIYYGEGFVDWELRSEDSNLLIRFYNTRNWIYPNGSEIWSLVLKAHEANLQPIILAPFIHGACFLIFKRVGILGRSLYRSFTAQEMPKMPPEKELLEINYSTGRFVNSGDDLPEVSSLLERTIPSLSGTLKKTLRKEMPHKELMLASKSCYDRNMQEQLSSLRKISDLLELPSRHKIGSLIQRYNSYLQP